MKMYPNPQSAIRNPQFNCAFFMVEALVYIAMLAILLPVAARGIYHCWNNHQALRRNADDIVFALHAGEQWRADLRAAFGPVQLVRDGANEQIRIPSTAGEVIYNFSHGELRRQTTLPAGEHVLLSHVGASQMRPVARGEVRAWFWELELTPAKKDIKVRPLFTFETVAGSASIP